MKNISRTVWLFACLKLPGRPPPSLKGGGAEQARNTNKNTGEFGGGEQVATYKVPGTDITRVRRKQLSDSTPEGPGGIGAMQLCEMLTLALVVVLSSCILALLPTSLPVGESSQGAVEWMIYPAGV